MLIAAVVVHMHNTKDGSFSTMLLILLEVILLPQVSNPEQVLPLLFATVKIHVYQRVCKIRPLKGEFSIINIPHVPISVIFAYCELSFNVVVSMQ